MKRLLSIIASVILLLAPLSSFAGQEVDVTKMSKNHQKAYAAALALYLGEGNETPRFICSTTVVARSTPPKNTYLLLTAGHCVTEDNFDVDSKFFVTEEIVSDPILQPISIVKAEYDDKLDFAILELESSNVYPVIPISDSDKPLEVESKVYDVNFSLGLVKQVALGEVASLPMNKAAARGECAPCEGRYLVHFMAGPGASGSAIIDEKSNKIVGIVELDFPGNPIGNAAETMKAFREFLSKPVVSTLPKVQGIQNEAK